jgi:predicted RNA-binding protein with RPS1 domain
MSSDANETFDASGADDGTDKPKRRILIGSQKDPAAYRPKRPRDWKPVVPLEADAEEQEPSPPAAAESTPAAVPPQPPVVEAAPVVAAVPAVPPPVTPAPKPAPVVTPIVETPIVQTSKAEPIQSAAPTAAVPAPPPVTKSVVDELKELVEEQEAAAAEPQRQFPPTNLRNRLSAELEDELNETLADVSMDEILARGEAITAQPLLELESQHTGRVVAIQRDNVFIELGSREQGVASLRQLPAPPEVGATVQVVVQRYNREEGLYELAMPNTAARVSDWDDLAEGMMVEAQVTGHNAGGLECEVNHLRGFIPVSQIALYRVENLEEFVNQRFTCLVTEANPQRRNLVLSRRAVLEREKEEGRQKLMATLETGQVHEGVVRKLMDFGAFVDIGGVDGLLHIGQLSWARVKHPSDVLQEGQRIQVKILKIDPETKKISLGYREMMENPWSGAASKYPPQSINRGVVTKLMEFGAFVQLEPGVEGLVHVSELSPKRVWRVADVVSEGQEVEVLVLSIDAEAQRISLSIKALARQAEPVKKEEDAPAEAAPAAKPRKKPTGPLKGGLGPASGGDRFRLRW